MVLYQHKEPTPVVCIHTFVIHHLQVYSRVRFAMYIYVYYTHWTSCITSQLQEHPYTRHSNSTFYVHLYCILMYGLHITMLVLLYTYTQLYVGTGPSTVIFVTCTTNLVYVHLSCDTTANNSKNNIYYKWHSMQLWCDAVVVYVTV